ncbi:helix-turn-helix domain-containing protein [Hyphomicrobium sp. 2TAF46]|uniref:helix-turn-helix domain-containing protein n=1 Tax=Hyphomicrobium sp. 2TAF46 TaxID=3233019 RepID=UPI003F8F8FC8
MKGKEPEESDVLPLNLARVCREQKLFLEKLAEASGVSRAMLNQIAAGRSVPTVDLAERIAIGLIATLERLSASAWQRSERGSCSKGSILTRVSHFHAPFSTVGQIGEKT